MRKVEASLSVFLYNMLTLEKPCRQGAVVGKQPPLEDRPVDLGFLDLVLTPKECGSQWGEGQDGNVRGALTIVTMMGWVLLTFSA